MPAHVSNGGGPTKGDGGALVSGPDTAVSESVVALVAGGVAGAVVVEGGDGWESPSCGADVVVVAVAAEHAVATTDIANPMASRPLILEERIASLSSSGGKAHSAPELGS